MRVELAPGVAALWFIIGFLIGLHQASKIDEEGKPFDWLGALFILAMCTVMGPICIGMYDKDGPK